MKSLNKKDTKPGVLSGVLLFCCLVISVACHAGSADSILIQTVNSDALAEELSQSVTVISARLNSFSFEKFEVAVVADKNQIGIKLPDNMDRATIERLISQIGHIGFYKIVEREDLGRMQKNSKQLFALLKSPETKSVAISIGSCSATEVEAVNDFFRSAGQGSKCKYAWGKSDHNSDFQLYALQKKALITEGDIDSTYTSQQPMTRKNCINFRFKSAGSKLWANITQQNIGNQIALIMDNSVLCTPIVNQLETDKKCMVVTDLTQNEAKMVEAVANNGVLPIEFEVVK